MIKRFVTLVCGEEHGIEIEFPDPDSTEEFGSVKLLRRAAKAAGWRRYRGEDYCPYCAESLLNVEAQS